MTDRRLVHSRPGREHDRRHEKGRLAPLVIPAALGAALVMVLAACSSQIVGPTTTTTSTATTSTSSTTTTTTTTPVAVAGTSILRARVARLQRGALVLPVVSEGSAAWLRMVPIAYRSFGTGPDLLLISGQDGTLSWWGQSLLSDLSSHYHVTLFDLPDVGYSGMATARLSLSWLADMTAGLVLTIGLSDPIVLGWGLGGQIALSLVERHPGFASLLILVDTSAGGAGTVGPSTGVVHLLAQRGATPVALSTLLFPATAVGLQDRLVWQSSVFAGTTDWMTTQAVEAEAMLQAAIWKSSSLAARLPLVTIPALVVSGADDVVFPAEDASRLAGELPHATEVSFPGAGYGAIFQDAPAFLAAVEKFTAENASSLTTTTTSSSTTTTSSTTSSSTTTTAPRT
ncbi:MAG: alpha/beta hydrolase [Acidimicrobiales bacterium]